jgi:hypothetical protein
MEAALRQSVSTRLTTSFRMFWFMIRSAMIEKARVVEMSKARTYKEALTRIFLKREIRLSLVTESPSKSASAL